MTTLLPALFLAGPGACVAVDGPAVTAADLARVFPRFRDAPPAAPVTRTPAPGVVRVIPVDELARVAARFEIPPPDTPVCFVAKAAPPDPKALLIGLLAAVSDRFPESASWKPDLIAHSSEPVPEGRVSFAPVTSVSPDRADGSRLYRGSIIRPSGQRTAVWMRVRFRVEKACLTALGPLAAGVPVDPSSVGPVLSRFPAPGPRCAVAASELEGTAPARAIPAGAMLTAGLFRALPDIRRGDEVSVEVHAGPARLSFAAKSESSGRRGDTVALVNPDTKRRFTARVAGPRRAVVETR